MDDAEVTPEASANFFSFLFFNWISPMMALGSVRPLQPTDLWKMDPARSSALLSEKMASSYETRRRIAAEYNAKLADPKTPLPLLQRLSYPLLPHREKRENDYRTKFGRKKASLAWCISDTFGSWFWMGGVFKVIGDSATACSPLVVRAIITWSSQYNLAIASNGLLPYPYIGTGIGLAFALLILLLIGSVGLHHFFVRELFHRWEISPPADSR